MIFQVENKNVHASDAGQGVDPKKQTIVFLHGSGMSHIVWSLTEQFFSNQNFNVLSIDLPGHGNSDGPCINTIEKIIVNHLHILHVSNGLEIILKRMNIII